MCGIAGLYNAPDLQREGATESLIRAMCDSMVHRGPDAAGVWSDSGRRCALGHRRLSIIDTSSAGTQPMSCRNGRWVISFNGEIYNFLELREELAALGSSFSGRTDTEVLLEAIDRWGTDALPRLDGMFAFGAFDTVSGDLVIARDAFGEKPLYWAKLPDGGVAFSSELQAIEHLPGLNLEASLDSAAELLSFQYIGAPRTIYRDVNKLPPGSWMRFALDGTSTSGQYFAFRPGLTGFTERPVGELVDQLEDILLRSLRRRLISDVPLGAFLSGGVDSSVVCALVRRGLGERLQTFSMGFAGAAESEHETARQFAQHLGTEHFEHILDPQVGPFIQSIGKYLDEPNGDSSCLPTYLLSQFARERVTVALSGDGGDELFGGYGRYVETLRSASQSLMSGPSLRSFGDAYYSDRILVSDEAFIDSFLGKGCTRFRSHLAQLRDQIDQYGAPLACALRATDVQNYLPGAVLPKVDRMSMQHSLEVRTPFLSTELARFAERLPPALLINGRQSKVLLRELAYRYLPKRLIDLPKQGFGIPMSDWARGSLLRTAADLLESDDSRLSAAIGMQRVESFMAQQRSTSGFSAYRLWGVVVLESWLRQHPARMPSIPPETAPRGRKTETSSLFAYPIGNQVFLAASGEGERAPSVREALATLTGAQMGQLANMFGHLQVPMPIDRGLATDSAFRLPGWNQGVSSLALPSGLSLNESTLIILDNDAAIRLDLPELWKHASTGVRRLVFFDMQGASPGWTIFRLQPGTRSARMRSAARLYGRRIRTFFVARGWFGRRLGATARHDGRNLFSYGLRSGLSLPADTEQSQRVAIFQGLKQLLPARVTHDDIAREGQGRYSFWSDHVFFSPVSPIAKLRGIPNVCWAVPITADIEQHLQIVPEVPPVQMGITTAANALVAARGHVGKREPLRAGDAVVLYTHALAPGGAERQWCYLAIELQKMGFLVTVVCANPLEGSSAHYLPLLEAAGVPVLSLSSMPNGAESEAVLGGDHFGVLGVTDWNSTYLGHAARLTLCLERLSPRAVIAQLDTPNIVAALSGLIAGTPQVVLSMRNHNPSWFPYIDLPWLKPLYQTVTRSRRIVLSGNSRSGNMDYASWMGVPDSEFHWIPNAIDQDDHPRPTDDALAALRSQLGIVPGARVVLGVFRLSPEKRPLDFIEVCSGLASRLGQLRVFIAGEGPLSTTMLEAIGSRGLGETITLLGRRTDIDALMAVSDVLLLTSDREGMPNAVMEAQIAGLPVVATSSGGIIDCVEHDETGLLADVGDIEGMVAHCEALLCDRKLASRIRAKALSEVKRRFSKARMAAAYIDLLNLNSHGTEQ